MFTRAGFACVVAALVAAAAPLSAQRGLRPIDESSTSVVQFTPYVGYMVYGNFLRGPVGTSLSTQNNAVFGAQVAVAVVPNVALYGNAAYGKTNLQVGVPLVGNINAGNTSVWLFDGGLQFTLPTGPYNSGAVRPFLQVGAGAVHYDVAAVNILHTNSTNFAANAGVGIELRDSGLGTRDSALGTRHSGLGTRHSALGTLHARTPSPKSQVPSPDVTSPVASNRPSRACHPYRSQAQTRRCR